MFPIGKIVVVGSINMDFVYYVRNHPLPGETISSDKAELKSGGKGANQAVAAALAGGNVTLFGAVGNDPFGRDIVDGLGQYGVNTEKIVRKETTTGTAFITVNDAGENTIVIGEGANGRLSVEDLADLPGLLDPASVLLLQNEIPWSCAEYAIEAARKQGGKVYLNPAPAASVPKDIFPQIDVLVLNETEVEFFTGIRFDDDFSRVHQAADHLLQAGVKEVVVTLGDKGSFYMNRQGKVIYTSACRVNAVDTTAAGDTFIGTFIVERQRLSPLKECLLRAGAASAIAVSRAGAQESIPRADEVALFMKQLNIERQPED
ncbi:ribokinase [Paenibacillus hamazuiensis]|uniref:ribokinase n=1 Tax=Paenibacillus hamazuiensis TaxID=2936508 RepID=UPI00200E36DA